MSSGRSAGAETPPFTVVHVITRLELGGAQENTLYTCEHLDPRRFRVVLAFGPGGLLDERLREAPPSLSPAPVRDLVREISPRRDVRALTRLGEILQREQRRHREAGGRPERFVVHTHSSKAGILGRLAAKRSGVRSVVHTIHGFGFHDGQTWPKYQLFLNAERAVARWTLAFVGVSHSNLDEARRKGIIRPRHRVELIRSGMDLSALRGLPEPAAARRALGLPEDAEVVLSIANFKPQKDPLTLIDAFARVAARRTRAHLVVAGDGELRSAVEARMHPIRERVHLLGWRQDVPRLLAAADVVALSSIFEGLPRSAVQAVAARRPFAGTAVDGTPEIIREGRNGYLVAPRDPIALAAAIERALIERPVDPEDEARIEAWDADRMVRAQEDLYASLAPSA